jgi:hypothetical protein
VRREEILADVLAAVAGIAKGEGYETDVRLASRDFRAISELLSSQLPAIFVNAGPESDEVFTTEEDESTLEIDIRAYVEAAANMSTALNALIGDIHKAVMKDRTRGADASDTVRVGVIDADEVSLAGKNRVGALMRYRVSYQRLIATLD